MGRLIAALLALALLPHVVLGLHFYLDAGERRCFSEDLPAGTAIVGAYKIEVWSPQEATYIDNPNIGAQISVVTTATQHTVIDQKGGNKGKFSFTASESGDHQICLSVNTGGWFGSRSKFYLDIQFAENEGNEKVSEQKKSAYGDVISRLRFLVARVQSGRNDLKHQRDREAEFRDASEALNSAAVRWTLVQMGVLGVTCAWQLRHLRQFFISKKLV